MLLMILALASVQQDLEINCDMQRNQLEMAECERIDYQHADAEMNRQLLLALAAQRQFDRDNREQMQRAGVRSAVANLWRAQRAWITYRDAHCQAEARNYFGDHTRNLILNMCLRQLTELRARQLLALSQSQED